MKIFLFKLFLFEIWTLIFSNIRGFFQFEENEEFQSFLCAHYRSKSQIVLVSPFGSKKTGFKSGFKSGKIGFKSHYKLILKVLKHKTKTETSKHAFAIKVQKFYGDVKILHFIYHESLTRHKNFSWDFYVGGENLTRKIQLWQQKWDAKRLYHLTVSHEFFRLRHSQAQVTSRHSQVSSLIPDEIPDKNVIANWLKIPNMSMYLSFLLLGGCKWWSRRDKAGMEIIFARSRRKASFLFCKTTGMFWESLRSPFCTTNNLTVKPSEPKRFLRENSVRSYIFLEIKSGRDDSRDLNVCNPSWRMKSKKGCSLSL